jgi:hypothetical protein
MGPPAPGQVPAAPQGPSGVIPASQVTFSPRYEADIKRIVDKYPPQYRDKVETQLREEMTAWTTTKDADNPENKLSWTDRLTKVHQSVNKSIDEEIKTDKTLKNASDINANTQTHEDDRAKEARKNEYIMNEHRIAAGKVKFATKEEDTLKKDWEHFKEGALFKGRGTPDYVKNASKSLMNANRAIGMLINPNRIITGEDANAISGDFSQLVTGKSATDFGMKEQTYTSLKSELAKAAQFASGHPKDALPKDIKQHILDNFLEFKKQNIGALSDYLNEWEQGSSYLIGPGAPYEEAYKNIKSTALSGGTYMQPQTATTAPKTQEEYNAIPSGTLYVDTDGQTKRKK